MQAGATRWLWCMGFSLQSTGSRHLGFSSCSMQALEQGLLPLVMCDLPGPGMEPVSPVLQGRLLTTGLPGKPGGTL